MATKLFYLLCLSFPGLVSYFSKSRRGNFRNLSLIIICGIFFLLLATTTGYSDLEQYKYHFETSAEFSKYAGYYFRHYRLPFFTFNALIRRFTDNFWIYNAFWAFLICVVLFITLNKLADSISLHWSVWAFSMVYFLNLISGKRFTLAFAFVLLGMTYYVKRQSILFCLCIVLATLFHISAVVVLAFWGAEFFFSSSFFERNRFFVFLFSVVIIVCMVCFREEWMRIVDHINNSGYAAGEFEIGLKFGVGWFLYWLPGLLIYLISKGYIQDKRDRVNYLSAVTVTALISSIGYMVYGLARVNVFLVFLDMYWIPYSFKQMELATEKGAYAAKSNLHIVKIFFALYILLRYYLYMSQLAYSSKIIPYQNIFGVTI